MLIYFVFLSLVITQAIIPAAESKDTILSISCNARPPITTLPKYHQHQWQQACKAIKENNDQNFPNHYVYDLTNKVWFVEEPRHIQNFPTLAEYLEYTHNFITLAEYLIRLEETTERSNLFSKLMKAGLNHTASYDIEMKIQKQIKASSSTIHFDIEKDQEFITEKSEDRTIRNIATRQRLIYYAIMHTNVSLFKQLLDQSKEPITFQRIEKSNSGNEIREVSLIEFIEHYLSKSTEKRNAALLIDQSRLGAILTYAIEHDEQSAIEAQSASQKQDNSCHIS